MWIFFSGEGYATTPVRELFCNLLPFVTTGPTMISRGDLIKMRETPAFRGRILRNTPPLFP